jgi:hypothetical protein
VTSPDTAKPATAIAVNGLRDDDRFAGEIDNHTNAALIDIQARRLSRRFALSLPVAIVVAGLIYGESAR